MVQCHIKLLLIHTNHQLLTAEHPPAKKRQREIDNISLPFRVEAIIVIISRSSGGEAFGYMQLIIDKFVPVVLLLVYCYCWLNVIVG